MEKLDAITNDVLLRGGLLAQRYGLPRTAGEIGGLLFMTDGPLSLDEIATALKVSKASVSTNVRLLESLRFVRRGDVREGRRDYYVIAGDVWDITGDQLRTTVKEEIHSLLLFARECQQRLKEIPRSSNPAETASLTRITQRVSTLVELYETVANLVDALSAGRKLSPSLLAALWKAAGHYNKLTSKRGR